MDHVTALEKLDVNELRALVKAMTSQRTSLDESINSAEELIRSKEAGTERPPTQTLSVGGTVFGETVSGMG